MMHDYIFEGAHLMERFAEDIDVEKFLSQVDQYGRLVAKIAIDFEGAFEPARSIRSSGSEIAQAIGAAGHEIATAVREGFALLAAAQRAAIRERP
jgi:hypothetical protein